MTGPKPMPDNVRKLRGGRYIPKSDGAATVEPEIEIPDCPAHLMADAKRYWKVLGPELEKLGLISQIDMAAMALVCSEYAWWVWHEKALKGEIQRTAAKRKAWEADEQNAGKEWAGGDGTMLPTPNGHWQYHPHWVMRNKHAQQLDRFLASFGMSPSARGKVTPSNKQLELPGMEPKEGFSAM